MADHLREHQQAGHFCNYDEVISEILADTCEENIAKSVLPLPGVV